MHLEEQKYILNKFKVTVEVLRVKNNNSSQKKNQLIFGNTTQPWQNGAIKTSIAVPMMYDDLYKQYGKKGMRTAKLNQDSEIFNFYVVLNDSRYKHDFIPPCSFIILWSGSKNFGLIVNITFQH